MDTKRGENFETESQANITPPAETEGGVEFVTDQEIEHSYDEYIREHNAVNFGKEALIFHLTQNEMPLPLKKQLTEAGLLDEDDAAVKVLKVYTPGHAEREYTWQEKAYRAIEGHILENPEQAHMFARVPMPIDKRTIKISEETKKALNAQGAQLKENHVEIIVMDFIDGEDLLQIFYKWVVKHAPQDKQYATIPNPDQASFSTLQQSVAGILEFGRFEDDIGLGYSAELDSRRSKLYLFLKKTGFKLPRRIVEQKRNTRKLLERYGIFHNDDHERNNMLMGDQLYLIDFARTDTAVPDEEIEFHLEMELEKLSDDYEIKEQQRLDHERERLFGQIREQANTPTVQKEYLIVTLAADGEREYMQRILANRGIAASANQYDFEKYLSLLVKLEREGDIEHGDAVAFLEYIKSQMVVREKKGRQLITRVTNPHIYNKIDSYRPLFH